MARLARNERRIFGPHPFIAPITRLPFELLQHPFLFIIDGASGPPLVLMLVCKHWHTIVTSIWGSLHLGTWTPKDPVTRKLERTHLDILVDTDSDRGDFTRSDRAFGAIFAAMEVSSRWRSLVVESFPGQADLPEDLVNRRLQQCSNATMSRFMTLKIKSACETRNITPPRPSPAHPRRRDNGKFRAYHGGYQFTKCHIIPSSRFSLHIPFCQSPLSRYSGDTQSSRPSTSSTSTRNIYCLSYLLSHLP